MSVTADVKGGQQTVELLQDPDALYAAAIGAIGVSPDIQALLSPIGKQILDIGMTFVENALGEQVSALGSAILGEITSLVGSEFADAVSSAAGAVSQLAGAADSIPGLGEAIGIVFDVVDAVQAQAAEEAAKAAVGCKEILGRPVRGTGTGYAILPSDVFNPEPMWIPKPSWKSLTRANTPLPVPGGLAAAGYPLMPGTSLGTVLAAITEDAHADFSYLNPRSFALSSAEIDAAYPHGIVLGDWDGIFSTGAIYDSVLHHSDVALHAPLPQTFGLPGAGIPKAIRRALQLLRLAIGSQNKDKGVALWPLYMDLLASQWGELGAHMTPAYAVFELLHLARGSTQDGIVVESATDDCANVDVCCDPDLWTSFVKQIDGMVTAWKTSRVHLAVVLQEAAPPPSVHMTFEGAPMAAAKAAATQALGLALDPAHRATWEAAAAKAGMTAIEIAAASPGAHSPGYSPALSPIVRFLLEHAAFLRTNRGGAKTAIHIPGHTSGFFR